MIKLYYIHFNDLYNKIIDYSPWSWHTADEVDYRQLSRSVEVRIAFMVEV